jgi:hypothetical protein
MIQPSLTKAEAVPYRIEPELTPSLVAAILASRRERVGLMREMLGAIEDATPGGQRYLMTKLLTLFRHEALDPGARFGARERDVVNRALSDLEHEAARMAPDASAYDRRAQILLDLFALA